MTYWIAIGVFLFFTNNGLDVSKQEQVRKEVYQSEEDCNTDVAPLKLQMDQFIADGKLAGYVISCKPVEVVDPVLPKGTVKKNSKK